MHKDRLDEQSFRFSERFGDVGDRFLAALHEVVGNHATYRKLTGKEGVHPAANDKAVHDANNVPEFWK